MEKAPSVRELSAKLTEGESLTEFEILDEGKSLSPTRFAGAPSQRGPFYIVTKIKPALLIIFQKHGLFYCFLPTPKSAKISVLVSSAKDATRRMRSGVM